MSSTTQAQRRQCAYLTLEDCKIPNCQFSHQGSDDWNKSKRIINSPCWFEHAHKNCRNKDTTCMFLHVGQPNYDPSIVPVKPRFLVEKHKQNASEACTGSTVLVDSELVVQAILALRGGKYVNREAIANDLQAILDKK